MKNEPKIQEPDAAKPERKTLKLKAAPDSGYGRRAGSDARDAMLAELADQVETAGERKFFVYWVSISRSSAPSQKLMT